VQLAQVILDSATQLADPPDLRRVTRPGAGLCSA
jgi:hypothetical protein